MYFLFARTLSFLKDTIIYNKISTCLVNYLFIKINNNNKNKLFCNTVIIIIIIIIIIYDKKKLEVTNINKVMKTRNQGFSHHDKWIGLPCPSNHFHSSISA